MHLHIVLKRRLSGPSLDEGKGRPHATLMFHLCVKVRKIAESVSKVAVVVGQFRELKRSSTVEIGEFIVNSVVSLLVLFPKPIAIY